jgi:RNA polymerase sigma-70 factor (family 1)
MEPVLSLSDSDLLERLSGGDEKAFTEVYNRYFGLLYIHAYKILGNEDEAKDTVQDLFSSLWIRRKSLLVTGSLSSYLYSAVRNKVFDILQHKKVENKYIDSLKVYMEKGYVITDHRIREQELSVQIEKEIAALPKKMRTIFELSRKSHYSHREIATELDISEQTVKTQVNNALRILRIKLGTLLSLISCCLNYF